LAVSWLVVHMVAGSLHPVCEVLLARRVGDLGEGGAVEVRESNPVPAALVPVMTTLGLTALDTVAGSGW
jgi:hypothetical protein